MYKKYIMSNFVLEKNNASNIKEVEVEGVPFKIPYFRPDHAVDLPAEDIKQFEKAMNEISMELPLINAFLDPKNAEKYVTCAPCNKHFKAKFLKYHLLMDDHNKNVQKFFNERGIKVDDEYHYKI